ncbi:MAG: hypothetical protein K1X74_06255 [Pirellulales bacterium]|nr:hypothetical protein [Pirellulales bacterium]
MSNLWNKTIGRVLRRAGKCVDKAELFVEKLQVATTAIVNGPANEVGRQQEQRLQSLDAEIYERCIECTILLSGLQGTESVMRPAEVKLFRQLKRRFDRCEALWKRLGETLGEIIVEGHWPH